MGDKSLAICVGENISKPKKKKIKCLFSKCWRLALGRGLTNAAKW